MCSFFSGIEGLCVLKTLTCMMGWLRVLILICLCAQASLGWADEEAADLNADTSKTDDTACVRALQVQPPASLEPSLQFVNLMQHDLHRGNLSFQDLLNFKSRLQKWQKNKSQPFPNPIAKSATFNLNQYHSHQIYQSYIENHQLHHHKLNDEHLIKSSQAMIAMMNQKSQIQKKSEIRLRPERFNQLNDDFIKYVLIRNFKKARQLLAEGVNLHEITTHKFKEMYFNDLRVKAIDALHEAVTYKINPQMVGLFLDARINVDVRDAIGRSPLSSLISRIPTNTLPRRRENIRRVIQQLVEAGADINIIEDYDHTGIWEHIYSTGSYERKDIVALLIELGADPERSDHHNRRPLHYAIASTWWDPNQLKFTSNAQLALQLIHDYQVNLNIKDTCGESLLHCAAANQNIVIIKLLVRKGLDLEAVDYRGYTPLHVAASSLHLETMKVLIDLGANINAQTHTGNTPLHLGTKVDPRYYDRYYGLAFLIERGANKKIKNNAGKKALQLVSPGLRLLCYIHWVFRLKTRF